MEKVEYYLKLKKRALLLIDQMEGKEVQDDIDKIEDELFGVYEPEIYAGDKGAEVRHVKRFNDAVISVSKELGVDAERMTVLKFYQALDLLNEQAKKMQKAYGNNKDGRFNR